MNSLRQIVLVSVMASGLLVCPFTREPTACRLSDSR